MTAAAKLTTGADGAAVGARCRCCGQVVDASDIVAAIERLRLPRREQQVLDALLAAKGQWRSAEKVFFALYGDDPDGGPECGLSVIQSYITKLRAKIAPLGLVLENERYRGYRLRVGELASGEWRGALQRDRLAPVEARP